MSESYKENSPLNVLISHASEEQALAEAWRDLLETTSSGMIRAWFSSDVTPTGGMDLGKEWRETLYQEIEKSHVVIALQTPTSVGRQWIMWECGVASGVEKVRSIVPVIFSMGFRDLASPLTSYEAYSGESKTSVREVCERLLVTELELTVREVLYEEGLKNYFESIELNKPRRATGPEQIELWKSRFEEKIRYGRVAEIPHLRKSMYESFPDDFKPTVASLHDLLSRTLLFENELYDDAVTEVDYALQIVGDDIELLHRKALALADKQDLPAAREIVSNLLTAHPRLQDNPELASLEGRIYRDSWLLSTESSDLEKAFKAYLRAYEADWTQYFPGINAGSLALAKEDESRANDIFQDVLSTCQELRKRTPISYWVDFSAGEAHLGLGQAEEAILEYQLGLSRNPGPPRRDKSSAFKGVARMVAAKGLDKDTLDRFRQLLVS